MSYFFSFYCFLSFAESAQVAVVAGIAVAVGSARATGLTDTLYDKVVGKICEGICRKIGAGTVRTFADRFVSYAARNILHIVLIDFI